MRTPTVALGLAVLAGLLTPTAAQANPDAKIRVHVDTDVFGVSHYNPDGAGSAANVNVVGFGIGRPSFIDTGGPLIFLTRPVLAIGVAGLFLDGSLAVGARAAFVVDGFLQEDNNTSIVGGRLIPYVNYIFNPRGRIRGFIGGRFGFGGAVATSENDIGDQTIRARAHSIYPVVGAQGGLHVFLVDRVSLDPALAFDYMAPHSRNVQIDPEPPPDAPRDRYDKDGDAINMAVTLGLSAWF